MSIATVLIVDDDLSLREILSRYLTSFGYQIITLKLGEKILKTLKEVKVNLLLLDILLPDVADETMLIRQVKENHPDIPLIIMTTALTPEASVKRALELGVAGQVSKMRPLNLSEILAKIEGVLCPPERRKEQ